MGAEEIPGAEKSEKEQKDTHTPLPGLENFPEEEHPTMCYEEPPCRKAAKLEKPWKKSLHP